MRYRIEQESGRDAFGNYSYRIYEGSQLVARYWHDHRGDEHGIEFVKGKSAPCPGPMTAFLEGGGPEPLVLSERALTYIDQQRP